jgi:hypothetical protein
VAARDLVRDDPQALWNQVSKEAGRPGAARLAHPEHFGALGGDPVWYGGRMGERDPVP